MRTVVLRAWPKTWMQVPEVDGFVDVNTPADAGDT